MPRRRTAPAPRPAAAPPSSSPPPGSRAYSTQPQQPPRPQPTHSPPPPHSSPPAPSRSPPPPAPAPSSGGGMFSGLMGTVAQGMALGTGSAIAHRTVDAAWGSFFGSGGNQAQAGPPPPLPPAEGPCSEQIKAFAECVSNSNGDMAPCEFYFNSMQSCKLGNPAAYQG